MSTRRPLPATHRPKHVFLGMVQEAGGPTWQSVELGLHEKPPEGYGGFARIGHTSRGCSYESLRSKHARAACTTRPADQSWL
jgi:hypothetical protein